MGERGRNGRGQGAGRVELIVYGCGTQGRAIIEFLAESGRYRSLRLTDDNRDLWGEEISSLSLKVTPPVDAFPVGPQAYVCTIGDNRTRQGISAALNAEGHIAQAVRHPSAIMATSASLGAGSILMARVVVNTESRVGAGCLLNTGCVVEHHCEIGDFVHLAPGVLLGGGVKVGEGAFVGLGAMVLPGLSVGSGAVVGAGAVVIRDVAPGATVAGNPARNLRGRPLP
ncbi:MAG: NeuD/PglB/VioB family sugar acetyltransferase [Bryobacterales bacterium]|nr:NeuD/PglB/VioB family sugar acetyltransferase [Bryobacterales bacterium]